MVRLLRCAGCLVGLAALLSAPSAWSHEEVALHSLSVLHSVEPRVDGLEVRIVHLGAPAVAVRNHTERVLTVLGEDGVPFLRIGPRGVQSNIESPTAYRSIAPGRASVPGVRAGSPPRWVTMSPQRSWSWFDPRIASEGRAPSWRIEMRIDRRDVVATGGFEPLGGHGHFVHELDAAPVEGLQLRLLEGPVPAYFVRNDTGRTLVVRGGSGEPLLRIGPNGVEANVRSPSYYTDAMQTIQTVPATADATAPPTWKRVSPQPVWAWLERRAAVPPRLQQRVELGPERATVLRWTSPMRLGDDRLEVGGAVEWIPAAEATHATGGRAEFFSWWIVWLVVGVAALLGASSRRRVTTA
ncbi:MAG: hypothetical protein ACRDKZ_09010 [Actinomycetota bacterium]